VRGRVEDVAPVAKDGEEKVHSQPVAEVRGETHSWGGGSRLTTTKAAWALASRFVKWGVVAREEVNQRLSHLSLLLGRMIDPSRCIGDSEAGFLSWHVRQWMSSVFGMVNPTARREPFAFRMAYCLCSS